MATTPRGTAFDDSRNVRLVPKENVIGGKAVQDKAASLEDLVHGVVQNHYYSENPPKSR